ncbi:MAG: 4Fe-4S binding protein, partial [Nitrososphaerales archaeon]
MSIVTGTFRALFAALRQLPKRRMTLRYPEVQQQMAGYYTYDPKLGVAKPGYKGRHILWLDKCTGCQLCSIACENISQAIEMVKVNRAQPNNRKSIFPQVDYAKCVFCGFCVDACPFYALGMTDDFNLVAYTKKELVY